MIEEWVRNAMRICFTNIVSRNDGIDKTDFGIHIVTQTKVNRKRVIVSR